MGEAIAGSNYTENAGRGLLSLLTWKRLWRYVLRCNNVTLAPAGPASRKGVIGDLPGRLLLPLVIAILGAVIGGVFYAVTVIIVGNPYALLVFLGFIATFCIQLGFLYLFTIAPLSELDKSDRSGVPLATRLENAKSIIVRALALKVVQEGGHPLSEADCTDRGVTKGSSYVIDVSTYKISRKSLDQVGAEKKAADFIDAQFSRIEDAKISRDRSFLVALATPFVGFGIADWITADQLTPPVALTLGFVIWALVFLLWEALMEPSIGALVSWSRVIYRLQPEPEEAIVDIVRELSED